MVACTKKIFFIFLFFLVPLNLLGIKVIPAGESIQAHIDQDLQENSFELENGVYSGNITITRPLTIKGKADSIILSSGKGTTIKVIASNVSIVGLTVNGSGGRYDQKDAALYVTADRVRIENVHIVGATFGIVVEQAVEVSLIGNTVKGDPDVPFGLRGDGIRIWETRYSSFLSNTLIDSRDMVVWYASSNTFKYNQMVRGRYGAHFMYSHYNQMSHNQFLSNVVGSFIMYSRHLTADHNLFAATSGPSGFGLGIKESGNLAFVSNVFVNNTVGVYSDNAPYDSREKNIFTHNLIAFSDFAIEFHGQPKRNLFAHNTLKGNRMQVRVSGKASAENITWQNNYFDDYRGYDLDKDGVGDLPYEYQKLMNDLSDKYSSLMFFDGTPVHYFINLLGEIFPMLRPQLIMRDPTPSVKPNPVPSI